MDRKKIIYIGSILLVTVFVSVTYFSYAFFTSKNEYHGKVNMVVGTLDYKLSSKDLNNNNQITLSPNSIKKIKIKVTSLNEIDSKYELFYETTSDDIEVGYTGEVLPTGTISAKGSKEIEVFLSNTTDSNITVTFSCEGGFTHNTLVKSKGISVPSQASICENYTTHVWNYDYTGDVQEFVSPCDGIYTLETWGAQGGNSIINSGKIINGGYGGYSIGNVTISSNSPYYIVVGGKGTDSITKEYEMVPGGYNGGGYSSYLYNAGGGGATHISNNNRGILENYVNNKSEVLIVSGGGGGASGHNEGSGSCYGGAAGGFKGNSGTAGAGGYGIPGEGGTQNNGYAFGKGFSAEVGYDEYASGGGGGWYGSTHGINTNPSFVKNTCWTACSGGGSSYIGNSELTNKAMYCYKCEESTEEDTYTISTINSQYMESSSECPDGYSSNPVSKCAKAGNGYVRITYKGVNTTKVTYDYNYLPNDIFETYFNTSHIYQNSATFNSKQTVIDSTGKTYINTMVPASSEVNLATAGYYFGSTGSPETNKVYTVSYEAKASSNAKIRIGDNGNLDNNSRPAYDATTSWQKYNFSFLATSNFRAFTIYGWLSYNEERTLYVRNIQLQQGNLYTKKVSYESGSTLSDIETPKRSGWTFVGWFTDPINGTQVTSSTTVPNSDITYYAHWTYNNE